MKKLALGIILASGLFCGMAHAVDKPTDQQVISEIKRLQKLDHDENILEYTINRNHRIRFIPGNFTGSGEREGIALCPTDAGRNFADYAVLMHKNKAGKWVAGRWHSAYQDKVSFTDIDNDNVKEIILEGGGTGQGYVTTTYKLVSIKNNRETVLYENSATDGTNSGLVMNSKAGDEISKAITVIYRDINKDGINELVEKTETGLFKSYSEANGAKLDYKKSEKIYYLTGGKYIAKK